MNKKTETNWKEITTLQRAWKGAGSCGGVLSCENCLEPGQVIWKASGQFYQATGT